ncbi:MAG: hypothetical protein ACRD96_09420 [Bryobacteraceae bacterium]
MRRVFMLALLAATAFAADISGAWDFTVETQAGSGNPAFTFKQDGEKLTGTYKGLFGEAAVTGSVKGDKVEFSFEASREGQSVKNRYRGTVEGGTKMKGEAELGELGKATWTAVKK